MTETFTDHPSKATAPDPGFDPAAILMALVVTLLAPMFLGVTGGDIVLARMAALATINGYQTESHTGLISIAQVIGYGLAALGSLSLSMSDDLSLSMTLRLRANANALDRSAERNRRVLEKIPPADRAPYQSPADAAQYEATVMANLADTQQRVADANDRLHPRESAAQPAPQPPAQPIVFPTPIVVPAFVATPAPIVVPVPTVVPALAATPAPIVVPVSTVVPALAATPAAPVITIEDQQLQADWAAAMADVAGEFTADLTGLPAASRKEATHRASLLSTCANALLSGAVPPRLRPGDAMAHFGTPRNPARGN
jgi:hypothetical protein